MVLVGLYLLACSIGFFTAAYLLGTNTEIAPSLKPQIALIYSAIVVTLYIGLRSVNQNSVGIDTESLKPYLPYTPKLAQALWVAAIISVDTLILGYVLLPTIIMWVGARNYPAVIIQSVMLVITCIFASSIAKYLLYSSQLETDSKKKLLRQLLYGIFILVFAASAAILLQAIPAYFASNVTQKYQFILALIQHPIYRYGISVLGFIPGIGITIVPVALITHNWIALAIATLCAVVYAKLYQKKWQTVIRKQMWGETVTSQNRSVEKTGNRRSRKLAKNLWPAENITKLFLKHPATRVHFSRQLVYLRRDPRAMVVTLIPIYFMLIMGALAYFQKSFFGADTPYVKVQALLFVCAVLNAATSQTRWYLDSTAYWYQIIAALPGKEDIKSRLLYGSLTTAPIFLIMSSLLQVLFQIKGIDILYTYVNTILAISISLTVGLLFSSCYANPGPAPGQGITNKMSSNGGSTLLQIVVVTLAQVVSTVLLLAGYLSTASITYFTGSYFALVLLLRLVYSVLLIWVTLIICGRLIDKNQVKLLQIVASWPKHTYHA